MTGLPAYNFPAFKDAAAWIRGQTGLEVVSPVAMDEDDTDPVGERAWAEYTRRDLARLVECRTVAVLDGWRNSWRARLEVHVATALGMSVLDAYSLDPITETVLEEAQRLIYGARQSCYGHPLDDFTRTGRIWGAILGIPNVPPEMVGLCMVGVKMSREVNHPQRDNRTDGAGYFGTVDMIHAEQSRRDHERVCLCDAYLGAAGA